MYRPLLIAFATVVALAATPLFAQTCLAVGPN